MFAKGLYHDLPHIQWQPPPLYFLHIPKTAGTSLEVLLLKTYGRQNFRFVPVRGLASIEPAKLKAYRCWRSHAGPGLIPFLPQENLHCITLLRQPVEHVVSHIYHTRRHLVENPARFDKTYLQTMQPLIHADLRTWLAHPTADYFDNFQTRHLGSVLNLAVWFKNGEFGRLGKKTPDPYLPDSLTDDSDMQQVFARACRQLDQMSVVGITEKFTESLELICALVGVRPPHQLPKENIGRAKVNVETNFYRQQIAPDLLAEIETRNQYDLALYNYACDCFARHWSKYQVHSQRTISIAPFLLAPVWQMNDVVNQVRNKVFAIWKLIL